MTLGRAQHLIRFAAACAGASAIAGGSARASGTQWDRQPTFAHAGAPISDAVYLGVRSGATDACDGVDPPKPGEPMPPYVYAYWDRPECEGDRRRSADWRAPLAAGECKIWDRLICYSSLAGTITMTWPVIGGAAWEPPPEYTFHLCDATLGVGPLDMETTSSYSWTQGGGGPSEPHEFVICVCAGPPPPPPACFSADRWQVGIGESVCFDAACSGTAIASYQWDFGDGTASSGASVCHSYVACGPYDVCLTVVGLCGGTGSVCHTVSVGEWLSSPVQGGCWHIITIPCEPFSTDPWEVFAEFRPPAQPHDLLSGSLHRYDPDTGGYRTYQRANPSVFGPITPGAGYWLYAFYDTTIEYLACCPTGPVLVDYPIAGWHLTGHPKVISALPVTDLTFRQGGSDYPYAAAAYHLISNPMFGYLCSLQGYENVGFEPWDASHTIDGFRGYWLCTFEDNVALVAP